MSYHPIKRALLSVSDKTNILELASELTKNNVEIISSGGTGKVLSEEGITYTPIEKFTGNPEAFGGRMKTLSFQVGSALLYKRDSKDDVAQAQQLNIQAIDLVVCNLYPFEEVYRTNESNLNKLIEYVDIGGPCMIRAAAKNFQSVCVITDPKDYFDFKKEYTELQGSTSLEFRKKMALKTFQHSAHYEGVIAQAFAEILSGEKTVETHPQWKAPCMEDAKTLRYGENPHQKGWVIPQQNQEGLAGVTPLQGKELSYNNFLDADAALRSNRDIARALKGTFQHVVTIIKHSNPCGAAAGNDGLKVLEEAWSGDPISSFGGIICFNQMVTQEQAMWLSDKFIEVVVAPQYSKEARELFAKKKNLRLLSLPVVENLSREYMVRTIDGGMLIQEEDQLLENEFQNVTKSEFDTKVREELVPFGLMVTKHLKSNAIALVGPCQHGVKLYGAGMGNPNRLISLEQAAQKVRENGFDNFSDLVLISDAFFPFADNIELANKFGITKIVEPGGSIKDSDVIKACDEFGMQMLFTGKRHFRH